MLDMLKEWSIDDQLERYWTTQLKPKSRCAYRRIWQDWKIYTANKIADAGFDDVERYYMYRSQFPSQSGRSREISDTVSTKTLARRVTILHSCYQELVAHGLVKTNPFVRLKRTICRKSHEERRPHKLLTIDQIQKLLSAPSPHTKEGRRDRAIFATMFGGGLRRGEVIALKLSDCELQPEGHIVLRLRTTKNGKTARVPLSIGASEVVAAYLADRQSEQVEPGAPLFTQYRQEGTPTNKMASEAIYRLYRRYCIELGIGPDYSPHSARASAITHLLDSGVSMRDAQRFSRHSSPAMISLYDKRREEVTTDLVEKLPYLKK
jgi:integrase